MHCVEIRSDWTIATPCHLVSHLQEIIVIENVFFC